MIPSSVKIALRDGRRCTIRPCTVADDAGLFELERAIVRAREGVVKWEDELPADADAYGRARGSDALCAGDGSAFCMVVEDESHAIVAEASLLRPPFRMLRHVASLGIGVHPDVQGLGVGRLLLENLLGWARAHRDPDGGRVTRVELFVRADNPRAIRLYHALGFELEGTRKAFHRRDDGALVDDLMMAMMLHEPR